MSQDPEQEINQTVLKETFGVEFENLSDDPEEAFKALTEHVEWLIEHNMDFLLSLMYRLDISEARIKQALHLGNIMPAAQAISLLIIERQKNRLLTRKSYRSSQDDRLKEMEW
jgi:hypothetical protein